MQPLHDSMAGKRQRCSEYVSSILHIGTSNLSMHFKAGCTCAYVYAYICTQIHIYIYTYIHIYTHTYIQICICTHLLIYWYTVVKVNDIYIYIYVYTYTYMPEFLLVESQFQIRGWNLRSFCDVRALGESDLASWPFLALDALVFKTSPLGNGGVHPFENGLYQLSMVMTGGWFTIVMPTLNGGFHSHGDIPRVVGLGHRFVPSKIWMMTGGTPMT